MCRVRKDLPLELGVLSREAGAVPWARSNPGSALGQLLPIVVLKVGGQHWAVSSVIVEMVEVPFV